MAESNPNDWIRAHKWRDKRYEAEYFRKSNTLYAAILYGQWKNYYLLSVCHTDKQELPQREISSYRIDECKRLNKNDFLKKIKEINHDFYVKLDT